MKLNRGVFKKAEEKAEDDYSAFLTRLSSISQRPLEFPPFRILLIIPSSSSKYHLQRRIFLVDCPFPKRQDPDPF